MTFIIKFLVLGIEDEPFFKNEILSYRAAVPEANKLIPGNPESGTALLEKSRHPITWFP